MLQFLATGSIFGIYSPNDECLADIGDDSALSDFCAHYWKRGVFAFTLDLMYGEFVLARENTQIPKAGKIYAFDEGNYKLWDDNLKKYIVDLKDPGPSARR
ncbi:hypothetical protein OIU85_016330 [Salix viminalis]|uniref:D-fructose-1,6-bisphosphate 1-phosphohydrolase n=1 Tax=Salix viminalis TaxID=40686 RepID=A0A9Q0V6W5_SALVM|nr:hypothetical protein OIU85_016330 [Salix viminalis]